MRFRTIREPQLGEAQGVVQAGPIHHFGCFRFRVSPAPEIEEYVILLGSSAHAETQQWFGDITAGILRANLDRSDGLHPSFCSVKIEILSVKTNPVDTSAYAWMRAGIHFRELMEEKTHPIDFLPNWRTTNVCEIADGIRSDKAFDRMPILADALQEAGCEDELILSHCRLCNDHPGKCWVVDLILNQT